MCGIFFSCSSSNPQIPDATLVQNLKSRGPDGFDVIQRVVPRHRPRDIATKEYHLVFLSTVLALRGDHIVKQPLVDDVSGSIFCWNGEAWKIGDEPVGGNDAEAVFKLFLGCIGAVTSGDGTNIEDYHTSTSVLRAAIRSISGPFSFVFYDATFQRIFYGRDPLGRRSLLLKKNSSEELMISSISGESPIEVWEEIEADGIYMLDLKTTLPSTKANDLAITFLPWLSSIPNTNLLSLPAERKRTAAAVKQSDLVIEGPFPSMNRTIPSKIPDPLGVDSIPVSDLHHNLHSSLLHRAKDIPTPPSTSQGSTRLAVLFSGGLDCTLLARLLHDILPPTEPIDLLNVAFENPRVVAAAAAATARTVSHPTDPSDPISPYSTCPDRMTGLTSHSSLQHTCPTRSWRFISIDVPYSETLCHRTKILSLMRPHATEMDFSIACALYFAGRGQGTIYDRESAISKHYTTPARVLFSGLGADELFGGYTRHATAFGRRGYEGLLDELALDFSRLGRRNLGRDDRVIAHWGREVRYPYLDEEVVRWALRLPVWEKCGFGGDERRGSGEGEERLESGKRVLRLLARRLGMEGVAREKKRAIQFGARTAKMVSGRSKGTQIVS